MSHGLLYGVYRLVVRRNSFGSSVSAHMISRIRLDHNLISEPVPTWADLSAVRSALSFSRSSAMS